MNLDLVYDDVIKFFVALISILNPLGVIPIFVSTTESLDKASIRKIARSCAVTVFITVLISLALGQRILDFFNISIHSFRVGGGLLIALMAYQMLQGRSNRTSKLNKNERDEIESDAVSELGVVPFAIPLLSGPGTISTVIIYAQSTHGVYRWIGCGLGTLVAAIIVYFVLIGSRKISLKIGRLGLNILMRIMGLLLMALAVESMASGLRVLLFTEY